MPKILQENTTNTKRSQNSKITPKMSSSAKRKSANGLIKKLHDCGRSGRPMEAEKHLTTMRTLYQQGKKNMRPDIRHYNSLMHAWVKSAIPNGELKANQILDWLIKMVRTDKIKNKHLIPSKISFNICINAWSKRKCYGSAALAWNLLEKMLELESEGMVSDGPDYHTYRAVLQALSQNVEKGTAKKAERIMERMKTNSDPSVKVDDSIYHVIMHIYSYNKEESAPLRCEELLNEMHELYRAGDLSLKPTVMSFNTLLNTYAKSNMPGAADRAENVLDHMLFLSENLSENGYDGVTPDCISFNTVLNCFARSNDLGSDRRAFKILTRMQTLYAADRITAQPNSRTYNSCIKACLCSNASGNEEEKEKSMDLAYQLVKSIDESKYVTADEYTFDWFFRVCEALCYREKAKLASLVNWGYDLCKKSRILTPKLKNHVQQIINMHYVQQPVELQVPSSNRDANSSTVTPQEINVHKEAKNIASLPSLSPIKIEDGSFTDEGSDDGSQIEGNSESSSSPRTVTSNLSSEEHHPTISSTKMDLPSLSNLNQNPWQLYTGTPTDELPSLGAALTATLNISPTIWNPTADAKIVGSTTPYTYGFGNGNGLYSYQTQSTFASPNANAFNLTESSYITGLSASAPLFQPTVSKQFTVASSSPSTSTSSSTSSTDDAQRIW